MAHSDQVCPGKSSSAAPDSSKSRAALLTAPSSSVLWHAQVAGTSRQICRRGSGGSSTTAVSTCWRRCRSLTLSLESLPRSVMASPFDCSTIAGLIYLSSWSLRTWGAVSHWSMTYGMRWYAETQWRTDSRSSSYSASFSCSSWEARQTSPCLCCC